MQILNISLILLGFNLAEVNLHTNMDLTGFWTFHPFLYRFAPKKGYFFFSANYLEKEQVDFVKKNQIPLILGLLSIKI